MTVHLNRRSFLAQTVCAPWLLKNGAVLAAPCDEPRPTLDIHVHLMGIGDNGSGCRISKALQDGAQFRYLMNLLKLRVPGKAVDTRYEEVLADQVASCGLTKAAIIGQDAVYDTKGRPDWDRTSFYVPSDYVFDVVGRHAETMVACPSINPARADALDELQRCHAKGARLIKIHPPTQGVNIADKEYARFFQCCCHLNIVVLVHTGHEHSAPVIDKNLASPRRLELALDQGCTVVACHAGTGWITDSPDQLPEFVELLKRYPKLWGDTAVLGTAGRVRDFGRLLGDREFVRSRLIHGSDFPFPANPLAFAKKIGNGAAQRLDKEGNLIKRDFALKVALGIGQASAERSHLVAGLPIRRIQ